MIDNIKNKIEHFHLHECPLKNRSLWRLVILLEASFVNVTVFIYIIMRCKKDYLHVSIDILFYIMFYISRG